MMPASNVVRLDAYRTQTPADEAPEVLEGDIYVPAVRASRLPVVRAHAARAGLAAGRGVVRVVHPVTVGRASLVMARGGGRVVGGVVRFAAGSDLAELKAKKPEKHWNALKFRWAMLGTASAAAYVAIATNPEGPWIAGGIAALLCAALGRKADQPIRVGSVLTSTDTLVRDAFVHVKLAKSIDDVRLVAPIQRHDHGWATTIELPRGVAASKAVRLEEQIASALGIPAENLSLAADASHAGRVHVRTSTQSRLPIEPVPHPYVLDPRPVDLWEPWPIAIDENGNIVTIELVFAGLLVGGLPRRGKSVLAANILIGALLDPHCQLWLVDGKGLDTVPLLPHAARWVIGADPEGFCQLIADLEAEMDRRYARLAELGVDKLSRQICRAEMPLIMLSIDELARYTASKDKRVQAAVSTLRDIVSIGPTCGIIPLLATQKPSAKVVPTEIRDLIPLRAAVACSTRAQSNTILGDRATVSATALPRDVIGAAYLVHGAEETLARPFLVDGPELRQVAAVAPRDAAPELISEVLTAMGGADRVPSAVLAERVGMSVEGLAAALRPHGIRPRQLGGSGNPRGYRLADIQAAT